MTRRRLLAHARRAAPVLALLVVAAVARGLLVDRHGLWTDELFSLAIATGHSLEHPAAGADPARGDFVEHPGPRPAADYARYADVDADTDAARIVSAVRRSDTNPPLYYLTLGLWIRAFGSSDAALRVFTAVAALLALPIIAHLARRLGGRRAVLPSCALYALLPASVYYGTEGRMYGLLLLAAAAALAFALRLHRKGTTGAAAGLVAVSAAGLLTHHFFVFLWVALVGWLLLSPGRARRTHVVLATGITVLLVAPWFLLIPELLGAWRVTGDWLQSAPGNYRPMWPVILGWRQVSARGPWGEIPHAFDAVHLGAFAVAGVLALRARRPSRPLGGPRGVLWLAALAPVAGVFAFDVLLGTYAVMFTRFATAALPAMVLLAGVGLGRVDGRVRAAVLAVLLVGCAVAGYRMHHLPRRNDMPYRELGQVIAARWSPEDLLLVQSIPSGVIGVARGCVAALGDAPGPRLAAWVGQLGQRHEADVARLAVGHRRVVVIEVHRMWDDPPVPRAWLDAHAVLESRERLGDALVSVYRVTFEEAK